MRRGVVALPRGHQSATFCVSSVHAIWAETQHFEASWQWISFLSWQVPARWMPVRRSVAESDAYEDKVEEEDAAPAGAAIGSTIVLPFYTQKERLEAIEVFYDAVLAVCDGAAIPQEALFEAQQASKFPK